MSGAGKIDTTIRQWCGTCGTATVSWADAAGGMTLRCSVCDPEHPEFPGIGLRDFDDDDEWPDYDD